MPELRDASRDTLLNLPIAASKELQAHEKETCFNLLGGQDYFTLMSRHPTAIRGLLRQPEFQPTKAYIENQNRKECIVGIEGTLPISCVHIGAARKRRFLSTVFSRRSGLRCTDDCASGTHGKLPFCVEHTTSGVGLISSEESALEAPDCVGRND